MNTDTYVLIRPINFQIAKVQPQGTASHLLDFLSISAWRCL